MNYFDVFNGDADGICSLIQLRLADPVVSTLITGVKRDIQLLKNVNAKAGDRVTVLDISMAKNVDDLNCLLENQVDVLYADHHQSGGIPQNSHLKALIDTSADVCTALIINKFLNRAYQGWAITAAFGDNLSKVAFQAGKDAGFNQTELEKLKKLGIYINYNGYGAGLDDLFFHPADLYRLLIDYKSPLEFIADVTDTFEQLETGYQQDMHMATELKALEQTSSTAAFMLPNEKWARRVSGVYSNNLANQYPERAHAVLTKKANSNYLVSIRAPLNNKKGADLLVSQFPTGGGRAGAAGINELPEEQLGLFLDAFNKQYR